MKKPEALVQLLEELEGENIESQVEVLREYKAMLYLTSDAASRNDAISLTGAECCLVFANEKTVERFLEAIAEPPDATLALFDVTLPSEIADLLERNFTAVDEG